MHLQLVKGIKREYINLATFSSEFIKPRHDKAELQGRALFLILPLAERAMPCHTEPERSAP